MSGIRGDILDVTTPGWLCCPAFRYTVEEITNATGGSIPCGEEVPRTGVVGEGGRRLRAGLAYG